MFYSINFFHFSCSQLYRTASFNSSGRSSNCDTTEDMYSDEDVQDLNHKVIVFHYQILAYLTLIDG